MFKPKGFTLLELLMVISMIALLLAIFLPGLQRVRSQGKAVVCQANLKQWGTMLTIYTVDNEGFLPPSYSSLWFLQGSYFSDDDPNKPPVYNDLKTKGIACCPMAVRVNKTSTNIGVGNISDKDIVWDFTFSAGSAFEAWEIISPLPAFRGSYGFNEGVDDFISKDPFHDVNFDISTIAGKSNIPLLLDNTMWSSTFYDFMQPPSIDNRSVFGWPFCINRHNGYINGLFLDWSVRKIGIKELWTLKWHREWNTANEWTRAGGVRPEDWPEWMRNFKDY